MDIEKCSDALLQVEQEIDRKEKGISRTEEEKKALEAQKAKNEKELKELK